MSCQCKRCDRNPDAVGVAVTATLQSNELSRFCVPQATVPTAASGVVVSVAVGAETARQSSLNVYLEILDYRRTQRSLTKILAPKLCAPTFLSRCSLRQINKDCSARPRQVPIHSRLKKQTVMPRSHRYMRSAISAPMSLRETSRRHVADTSVNRAAAQSGAHVVVHDLAAVADINFPADSRSLSPASYPSPSWQYPMLARLQALLRRRPTTNK